MRPRGPERRYHRPPVVKEPRDTAAADAADAATEPLDPREQAFRQRVDAILKAKRERYGGSAAAAERQARHRAALQQAIEEYRKIEPDSRCDVETYEEIARLVAMGPVEGESHIHFVARVAVWNTDEFRTITRFAEQILKDEEELKRDAELLAEATEMAMLEDKAFHHEYSGLFKRSEAVRDRFNILRRGLETDRATEAVIVVAEIDLVDFKLLNSRFGNNTVDTQLYPELGKRLRALRVDDIACQTGGDEFQIIGRCSNDKVREFIERIRSVIEDKPYTINGESVNLSIRMGAEVHDFDAVQAMDTTDAASWYNQLRQRPLEAAKYVKVAKKKGVEIWRPDLEITGDMRLQLLIDSSRRGAMETAAEIARYRGDAAATLYLNRIADLTRQALLE